MTACILQHLSTSHILLEMVLHVLPHDPDLEIAQENIDELQKVMLLEVLVVSQSIQGKADEAKLRDGLSAHAGCSGKSRFAKKSF